MNIRKSIVFIILCLFIGCANKVLISDVLPKGEIEDEYGISEILVINPINLETIKAAQTHLAEKHALNPKWLGVQSISQILSNKERFTRLVFIYSYNNVVTRHGPPSQRFIIWLNLDDTIEKTIIGSSIWPL